MVVVEATEGINRVEIFLHINKKQAERIQSVTSKYESNQNHK